MITLACAVACGPVLRLLVPVSLLLAAMTPQTRAGIVVLESGDGTELRDDAPTDQVAVALDTPPLSDVTVTVRSSDPGVASVSPHELTFAADRWDDPQTVEVRLERAVESSPSVTTTLTVAVDEARSDSTYRTADAVVVPVSVQLGPLGADARVIRSAPAAAGGTRK